MEDQIEKQRPPTKQIGDQIALLKERLRRRLHDQGSDGQDAARQHARASGHIARRKSETGPLPAVVPTGASATAQKAG